MQTKKIKIGNLLIGGGESVKIQSMCNTLTSDIKKTTEQILSLEKEGCEIIRVAVPDEKSALSIDKIKENINIPLVADIHFDYKLAIMAMERGIDKVRINPGNIGSEEGIKKLVECAKKRNIPIRIGVNSGSIEKDILLKYGHPTAEGMVESAKKHIDILNRYDFDDIVISLKASSVSMTIDSYRLMSERFNYPLHLGVTEAGTFLGGTIKSAIGIGALLNDGIGDTIRVSLTDDPKEEIKVAKEILKALDLRREGARLVSCPTCARTKLDLISLAKRVDEYISDIAEPITVAVMGCVVNGPGEAREADIGIAGGDGEGLIFKKGEIIKKVREEDLFEEFRCEIEKMRGR